MQPQPPAEPAEDTPRDADLAVFFKERFGALRIAAAGLLVVGIGVMLYAV